MPRQTEEQGRLAAHSAPTGTLRRAAQLVAHGFVAAEHEKAIAAVGATYTIAVPAALAVLIDPLDPNDPIARQVIPDPRELAVLAGDRSDPIGDDAFSPVKGITHRYPDRVLLKPLLSCPMYCRFCFRREVVGRAGGALTPAEVDAAIAYVAGNRAIREVILTGGDPLMLSARRLAALFERLAAIEHVESLRVHTRVPVAEPARIDDALIAALRPGKPVWVSVHCNHPRELAPDAVRGLALLVDGGVPLLAQTVLLRGVNDDPAVLEALFRRLVQLRVKPYYLHHPDMAPGTAHFRLGLEEGRAIFRALRGRVPGHALPTYVLDIPGGAGKVPVDAPWVREKADGTFEVTDPNGRLHAYP